MIWDCCHIPQGCGSQAGLVYDLGLLSYTSEKYDSADCWSRQGMVDESSSLKSLDASLQKDCWHSFIALKASEFILTFSDVFFAYCVILRVYGTSLKAHELSPLYLGDVLLV